MISIVVVHYGDDWTHTPMCLKTLNEHALEEGHVEGVDYEIICVLNNSDDIPWRIRMPAAYYKIRDCPYATAVNYGVSKTIGDHLLILNNDTYLRGPYLHLVGKHPLEGVKIMPDDLRGGYIEGWCMSVRKGLWDMLNGFDEQLKNSWEDVDFSQRARMLGFEYHQLQLPISHVWGATRNVTPGANRWDDDNQSIRALKLHRMDALFKRGG